MESYTGFKLTCVVLVAFPFCETQEILDCHWGQGYEYAGAVSRTKEGRTCQKWNVQSPHAIGTLDPQRFPSGSVDHNHCRNLDGKAAPWCYTTDEQTTFEFCDVPVCSVSLCTLTSGGQEYMGQINVTIGDIPCQPWQETFPHQHGQNPENFPEGSLEAAENYCRNPDGEPRPWCYTSDIEVRWQICDVPQCPRKIKIIMTTTAATTTYQSTTDTRTYASGTPMKVTTSTTTALTHSTTVSALSAASKICPPMLFVLSSFMSAYLKL